MRFEYIKKRHAGFVLRLAEEDEDIALLLEFLADSFGGFPRSDSEGNERRRDVDIIEGTAHGVLAADRSQTKAFLHMESTEECGRRFAPAGLVSELFEVFLQRQVGFSPVSPHRYEAGHGEEYGIGCTMERAPGCQIRIEAMCHEAGAVSLSFADREFRYHPIGRGLLVLAAEWHEYGTGTDGGVEAFGESLLRAVIEICHGRKPGLFDVMDLFFMEIASFIRLCDVGFLHLLRPIRVEEISRNIDDGIPSPLHDEAAGIGHISHDGGFEVFFCGIADELVCIFFSDDDRHTLLRFGNRQLGPIKAFVFLRYLIKIDVKAVCQFTDSDRDTACAEVIAAFDEACDFSATEEALDLSFRDRIALLDFCAASLDGLGIQLLRRACRTAHAVTARAPADQDDDVAGCRRKTDDMVFRSRCDDGADLHALRHESRMIIFLDLTGGKTDLIAVGGVALGRFDDDLSLRELACKRFGKRHARVCGARHAHRLIHIGASGERVSDTSAQAGRCPAEWLDLGRMVVCFILEKEQPVFLAVDGIDLHLDGAGIDLFRLIQIFQLSFLAESLDSRCCHIHQRHRALRILAIDMDTRLFVVFERLGDRSGKSAVFDFDRGELGGESGVTAVVGPVGIEHTDLCHGRISLLFIAEIVTDHRHVIMAHGKAHVGDQGIDPCIIQLADALDNGYCLRVFDGKIQRFRRSETCFTGLHRIHKEFQDLLAVAFCEMSIKGVDQRTTHTCAIFSGDNGQTLLCRVRSLVILSRQEFDADDEIALWQLRLYTVDRRFREYGRDRFLIVFSGKSVDIVAMIDPTAFDAVSQHLFQLSRQALFALTETSLLSYIQTSDIRQVQHSFLVTRRRKGAGSSRK